MPKDVHEKAVQELKRLELMPPMSAESTVCRNYLDWLIAVPWKKRSKEIRDIKAAEKVLNEEHYGLEKIGRASCRERVEVSEGGESVEKKGEVTNDVRRVQGNG